MKLVLYSKPGCHLCEGLEEKLAVLSGYEVEIRDITTRPDWFEAYQYEIPVLCYVTETSGSLQEFPVPRISPRASVAQVDRMIQKHIDRVEAE
ncbi:glutaredoxin family protein [filamentous cyanobacterium CCP5]|nr:glutaredoxin family protein [filamentous cyanobacterium CCP5]